jgi:GntR family transcriptional regulator
VIELASRQASQGVLVPSDQRSDTQRVIDGIIGQIRLGVLRPGDRLPSIRDLAVEYVVGQTTVKTALGLLKVMGWVRGHQGKATFVADAPPLADRAD